MDSTIVLTWVGSHDSRWKTFVSNRVAKIQTLSSATRWHHNHIRISANPADLATRGTDSSVPSLNDAVPEERYCTKSLA
ncbi:hypothetical protein TNCV_1642841 [Trichonephila clavipes]|nr:hypothetical protein TNCV_1642841 [Trichonephila clavipes]